MIDALINTYIQFWKNGLDFKGRTRRKDFWVAFFGYLLTIILGFLIITFFFLLFLEDYYPIAVTSFVVIYPLMTLIPFLAISVRRLHDIGLSGWWLLLIILLDFLVPTLNVLRFLIATGSIIVFSIPSQPFTNRYGENPLEKSPSESKTTPSDENSQ